MYPFRNLIFEGGGVKGIAYVGAMQILAEEGILDQIERVGVPVRVPSMPLCVPWDTRSASRIRC